MGVIDSMMDIMIKLVSREKREEMMINMMPLMMEGIDMNKLMPRMMTNMLQDMTADDIINYVKTTLRDRGNLDKLGAKIGEANLMQQIMFAVDTSGLSVEETVASLTESARQNGWVILATRDLQHEHHDMDLTDVARCVVLYVCHPQGEYTLLTGDRKKATSVMIPVGISVYETADGRVEIATMNLSLMSNFFSGDVKEVLKNSGERYKESLEGIVA